MKKKREEITTIQLEDREKRNLDIMKSRYKLSFTLIIRGYQELVKGLKLQKDLDLIIASYKARGKR